MFIIFALQISKDNALGYEYNINKSDIKENNIFECTQIIHYFHCVETNDLFNSSKIGTNWSKVYESTTNASFVKGKYDKAVELFANRRESIEIDNVHHSSSTFSISFWLQKEKDNDKQRISTIISQTNSQENEGWIFREHGKTNNSTIDFIVTDKNRNNTIVSINNQDFSYFTHIAATFDNSKIRIYLNGSLVEEKDYTGSFSNNNIIPMRIGSLSYSYSNQPWSGILDDLQIYNKTLTEREILSLYNDNVIPIKNIGWWKFNGNLTDSSKSNGNHGSLFTMISSMDFAKDGRLFFAEKNTGKIKILQHNKLIEKPFVTINDHYVNWEQGLLGLTLDPFFEKNHYIYLYYTAIDKMTGFPVNKVVRFTENNNTSITNITLLDKIPASEGFHSGGALAFGHDDKLYVTVGDATHHIYAQNPSILIGKVLRINRDGTIPQDNPFANSPVYTFGHRNMYGIAFDKNGTGIVTENNQDIFDEINILVKKGNYGFPTIQPANTSPYNNDTSKFVPPIRAYIDSVAPTQALYYPDGNFDLLNDSFIFGTFQGNIHSLKVENEEVKNEYILNLDLNPLFEPVIGIADSSHGEIYFGGYNIYKLIETFEKDKLHYSFFIETSTMGMLVKNLQLIDKNNNNKYEITLQLDNKEDKDVEIQKTDICYYQGIPTQYYTIMDKKNETNAFINEDSQTNKLIINIPKDIPLDVSEFLLEYACTDDNQGITGRHKDYEQDQQNENILFPNGRVVINETVNDIEIEINVPATNRITEINLS